MKNLWAIKPFEEENYYSTYRKRNYKKVIIEEKFPNINLDNKHIKSNSIQFTNSYFQKYFKKISIPENHRIIIDKNSKNKRKYIHKNFLLSMKYFIFLKQENLTDDFIDQLNSSNDVLLNDNNYIKGKIKVKEKIKKQLKKYNFEQQIELLLELNNIPNNILDKTANYIIETIKNKKIEKLETERPKLIIHNVYFDWILFSIFHKIEIKNQYNDNIKKEYVINLLQNEIKNIQDNVVEYIKKNLKNKHNDIENLNNSDFELFMTLKKKYQLKDEFNLNEIYYKKNKNNTLEPNEKMLLKQIMQNKNKGKIKFPNENLVNIMKNYSNERNNSLNQNDSSLQLNDNQNLKYKDISTNTNINYNINYNKTYNNKFNSLTNNNYYLNKLRNKNISNIINNGNTENDFNNINYKTISTISRNENKNTKINLIDGWNSYRNTYSNSLFDTKRTTNTNNYTIKNEDDDNKNISIYENENTLNKNLLTNKFSNNISQNKIKKKINSLNDLIQDKIDFDNSDDNKIKNKKYFETINKKILENNEKNIIYKNGMEKEDEYENNYEKSGENTEAVFNDFVQKESLENNNEENDKNLNNNLMQSNKKRKNISGIKKRNKNILSNNKEINNLININDKNKNLFEEKLNNNINNNYNYINYNIKNYNNNIENNNNENDNIENNNNENDNNETFNNNNYNYNNENYNENQSNNKNNLISNSNLNIRKYSLNNNLLTRKSLKINKENIKFLETNLFEKKENLEDESEEEEYNEEEDEEEKLNKNINKNKNENFKNQIENNKKKEINYSPKKSQELKIKKEEEERIKMEKIRLLKQKEMENFINSKKKQNLIKIDNNPYKIYLNNIKKNTLEQNQFLRKIYFKNITFLKEKSKKITIYEEEKIKNLPVEEIKKENEKIIKIAIGNENMRKLIYDNSYLFKNKNELYDNEIRNNIDDIINGNYEIKEIKKEEKVIKNVVHSPIKKKKLPKQYIFQKDGLKIYLNYDLNKEDENDIMKKNLEQKKLEEENTNNKIPHEIRLKNFFDKIKKLKESNFDKFDEEIDELLQQQINDSEFGKNKKREINLKKFSLTLNDFRLSNENMRKIKIDNLRFRSPCIFSMEKKN